MGVGVSYLWCLMSSMMFWCRLCRSSQGTGSGSSAQRLRGSLALTGVDQWPRKLASKSLVRLCPQSSQMLLTLGYRSWGQCWCLLRRGSMLAGPRLAAAAATGHLPKPM